MNLLRLSIFRLPPAASLSLVFSCTGPPAEVHEPPPVETIGQVEESVRPGINDPYLAPDVDPAEWVDRLEREGREVYDRRFEILEVVGLEPGMVVADIGAGTGLFVPHFSRAVEVEGKVYAVDIVPEFLSYIEERAAAEGLENVETVLATERSVELPGASVDLAFLCDVYHHFEYPQSSLASLHDAIRPGGELILIDFKRIPGVSSDWVLDHVRAGEEVFTEEIEAAGFQKVERYGFLNENYMIRFRRLP